MRRAFGLLWFLCKKTARIGQRRMRVKSGVHVVIGVDLPFAEFL